MTAAVTLLGSLVYERTGSSLTLESAAFPEGRIYATSSGYIPRYFIKDHLGSVRVEAEFISNGIEVTARHDYYPFGLRVDGGLLNAQSRFLYNGKEKQIVGGLDFLDYGARNYNPLLGRFFNADPLAEKFPGISPFAYCANNPIRYIDPTGMIIEDSSLKKWEKKQATIQRAVDKMQNRMDKLVSKGASESRIGNLGERISSINSTLGTMRKLEASTQTYALATVGTGKLGGLSYDNGTGIITIAYRGTANFIHEVTHGGQFESGDIAFALTGDYTYGQDVYDEVAAYKAQYAYKPASVTKLTSSSAVNSFADINSGWVQGLVYNGKNIYTPTGQAKTGLYPINIDSTKADLIKAYPKANFSGFSNTIPFRNMFPMHYKK